MWDAFNLAVKAVNKGPTIACRFQMEMLPIVLGMRKSRRKDSGEDVMWSTLASRMSQGFLSISIELLEINWCGAPQHDQGAMMLFPYGSCRRQHTSSGWLSTGGKSSITPTLQLITRIRKLMLFLCDVRKSHSFSNSFPWILQKLIWT